jgi:hypothetical protein
MRIVSRVFLVLVLSMSGIKAQDESTLIEWTAAVRDQVRAGSHPPRRSLRRIIDLGFSLVEPNLVTLREVGVHDNVGPTEDAFQNSFTRDNARSCIFRNSKRVISTLSEVIQKKRHLENQDMIYYHSIIAEFAAYVALTNTGRRSIYVEISREHYKEAIRHVMLENSASSPQVLELSISLHKLLKACGYLRMSKSVLREAILDGEKDIKAQKLMGSRPESLRSSIQRLEQMRALI